MRDDFTESVKWMLARRVAFRCSRPECRAQTSGPQDDPTKAVNIGVAAHISAASVGGPRYDSAMTSDQRQDISNGIWLCQNCAKLVDSDLRRFTVEVLLGWKRETEEWAKSRLGREDAGREANSLRIELPGDVNPVGYRTAGDGFQPGWRVRLRLISESRALDIVELGVEEDGVGKWRIREIFREGRGDALRPPISVERSVEFWIDAESPMVSGSKGFSLNPVTFWFKDHTGQRHELVVESPPRAE
jgi:hypothetical protein